MAVVWHQWFWHWLWIGMLGLYLSLMMGCVDKSLLPPQPAPTKPYALLTFSAAMQLLSLDQQTIDTPTAIRTLRVSPGQHSLRFLHVNDGPEGSTQHAGQRANPFVLETFEGLVYKFEAKT